MVKKLTKEEFQDVYFECGNIYEFKYIYESFRLDDISDMTAFIYEKDSVIIGFGIFQDLPHMSHICYTTFIEEYEFSDEEVELTKFIINYIISLNRRLVITSYLTEEKEKDFYEKMGFTLYKDFKIQSPSMFKDTFGRDLMRFVMEIHINKYVQKKRDEDLTDILKGN